MKYSKTLGPKLAKDPVEFIGQISRVRSSVDRLKGKNKLDARQMGAAESYRAAFETVQSQLGGVMDFSRVRGEGGSGGLPEAWIMACQRLQRAKETVGKSAIVIIEQIVCRGYSVEETARVLFCGSDQHEPTVRDINYTGRRLREALSELAALWHPQTEQGRTRTYRPFDSEASAGDAGVITITSKPFVMR